MQYLPNTKIPCLTYSELVQPTGVVPKGTFDSWKARGDVKVYDDPRDERRKLIDFYSLPVRPTNYQAKVIERYGEPAQYIAMEPLRNMVERDLKARQFFAGLEMTPGVYLKAEKQAKFSRQADWLNMITRVLEHKEGVRSVLNLSMAQFWDNVVTLIKNDTEFHDLPTDVTRLQKKWRRYRAGGYASLADQWRYGNKHAQVVSDRIEALILGLYAKRHCRSTLAQVCKDYNEFMAGKVEVVNMATGEVFDRADFLVKGKLQELPASTVKYWLNKTHNRKVIDALKLSGHDYQQKWVPMNRRKGPEYAFSAVSMDDYLPPFKTPDGKRAVWMYVIFDMASKAIVGVSYGLDKNHSLVDEALRDMLRLIIRQGWGLPMEMELERSLNWERRGSDEQPDIFTTGNVFPFVRFARGDNSQDKLAERLLGSFKYEHLADEAGFLGRPFGANENMKLNRDKKETRYQVEQLIAMFKKHVAAYNAAPHDTKPEMSRWDFLCRHQNPATVHYPAQLLMPYVGYKTETSIRRGEVQVQNDFYTLHDFDVQQAGGVAEVDAYWIPGAEGEAPGEVFVFQKGRFVGEAKRIERYQRAQAERTAADTALMGKQSGRQKAYRREVKKGLAGMMEVETSPSPSQGGELRAQLDMTPVTTVRIGYNKLQQETDAYDEISGKGQGVRGKKDASERALEDF